MGSTSKIKRKNYFIDKKFQRKFIIKFCGLIAAGSVIFGLIVYFMSKSTLTTTFENSRLVIKSTADFVLPLVLLGSAIVIAVIGFSTIAITLFTSHKIAGPLYRMQKDVEEVSTGNLKKTFALRQTDEIKALAVSLGNMTEALRGNIAEVKAGVLELEPLMESKEGKAKLKKVKIALAKFIT